MKPQAEFSAERKLILALVGCKSEALAQGELSSLLRQIRWGDFLATTSHDLYPYLAFELERHADIAGVEAPQEWELLRRARRLTGVHNLRLRHELGNVIQALNECAIPTLALKGIVLAYTAYPDLSLRPMADLDLLVPLAKREETLSVLKKLGFQDADWMIATHRNHSCGLDPQQEYGSLLQLHRSSLLLEVHSQLECGEPLFPVPMEDFWSHSVVVDIKGLKVRSLCPEDFLFHVCLHQSRSHRFEKGVLPLIDVRFLLESHTDWDWRGIAARSIRCGCATWMHVTLGAARDLVGAPVPDIFFEALPSPPEHRTLRCCVEDQILAARNGLFVVPEGFHRLLAEPSWRGRAHLLFIRVRRIVAHEEVEGPLTLASLIRRARRLRGRLRATFKTPAIQRFFRAWKRGRLIEAVRSTARQLQKANTLYRLVAEQEASGASRKDHARQG